MKILLTGLPGCGKSTVLARIIDILKKKGLKVGGIITPEIRSHGKRVGFKVVDVYYGEEGVLAKICTGVHDMPRLGKYCVDVKDFERVGLKALDFAVNECDIVCVDELAPMEMFSEKFKERIENILKSKKTVIAVLHRNLVGRYGKYGKVMYVTQENRKGLVDEIVKMASGSTQNRTALSAL